MQNIKVYRGGAWQPVAVAYWDGSKWVHQSNSTADGLLGRPSYWRDKILTRLSAPATVERTITTTDSITTVLSEMYSQAKALPGTNSPLVKNARLRLTAGTYNQFVNVGGFAAGDISLEIVGDPANRGAVVIESPANHDATVEMGGASGVFSYLTIKKTNAPVNRGIHGGVTAKGKATELVVFETTILTTGAAQSFSWEASSGRTLYVADSEVIGKPYMHTLYGSGTPGLGTKVIFDNVKNEITSINDEVADAADVFVHRSGWNSAGVFNFNVGRRDGSSTTPTMHGIIDPNSGIRSTSSNLVEFKDPDMEQYPILNENIQMLDAWK